MSFDSISYDKPSSASSFFSKVNQSLKCMPGQLDSLPDEHNSSALDISHKKIDMDALKLLPSYIEKVSNNIKAIDSLLNKSTGSHNQIQQINPQTKTNDSGTKQNSLKNLSDRNTTTPTSLSMPHDGFAVIEERDEDIMSRNSKILRASTYKNENPSKKPSTLVKKNTGIVNQAGFCTNQNSLSKKVAQLDLANLKEMKPPKEQKLKIKKDELDKDIIANPSYPKKTIPSLIERESVKEGKLSINLTKGSLNTGPNEKVPPKKTLQRTKTGIINKSKAPLLSKKETIKKVLPDKSKLPGKTSKPTYKDQSLNTKRSAVNLKSKITFNNKLGKKTKGLTTSSGTCTCNCHLATLNSTPNTNTNSISVPCTPNSIPQRNKQPPSILIPQVVKLKDILDFNPKSFAEMIYLFQDINVLNKSVHTGGIMGEICVNSSNLHNLNKKLMQNDFTNLIKHFIDTNPDDDLDDNFNGCKMNSTYSSHNSSLLNISFEKRRSELNKRRDEVRIRKIITIQRKWREYKIMKMLYPLLGLVTKKEDLKNFSIALCNKADLIKLCKLHIYSNLLKYAEHFKNLISVMNHANNLWTEFVKNPIYSMTKDNLVNEFTNPSVFETNFCISEKMLSSRHNMGKFQEILSRIISNEIKLTSGVKYAPLSEKKETCTLDNYKYPAGTEP